MMQQMNLSTRLLSILMEGIYSLLPETQLSKSGISDKATFFTVFMDTREQQTHAISLQVATFLHLLALMQLS